MAEPNNQNEGAQTLADNVTESETRAEKFFGVVDSVAEFTGLSRSEVIVAGVGLPTAAYIAKKTIKMSATRMAAMGGSLYLAPGAIDRISQRAQGNEPIDDEELAQLDREFGVPIILGTAIYTALELAKFAGKKVKLPGQSKAIGQQITDSVNERIRTSQLAYHTKRLTDKEFARNQKILNDTPRLSDGILRRFGPVDRFILSRRQKAYAAQQQIADRAIDIYNERVYNIPPVEADRVEWRRRIDAQGFDPDDPRFYDRNGAPLQGNALERTMRDMRNMGPEPFDPYALPDTPDTIRLREELERARTDQERAAIREEIERRQRAEVERRLDRMPNLDRNWPKISKWINGAGKLGPAAVAFQIGSEVSKMTGYNADLNLRKISAIKYKQLMAESYGNLIGLLGIEGVTSVIGAAIGSRIALFQGAIAGFGLGVVVGLAVDFIMGDSRFIKRAEKEAGIKMFEFLHEGDMSFMGSFSEKAGFTPAVSAYKDKRMLELPEIKLANGKVLKSIEIPTELDRATYSTERLQNLENAIKTRFMPFPDETYGGYLNSRIPPEMKENGYRYWYRGSLYEFSKDKNKWMSVKPESDSEKIVQTLVGFTGPAEISVETATTLKKGNFKNQVYVPTRVLPYMPADVSKTFTERDITTQALALTEDKIDTVAYMENVKSLKETLLKAGYQRKDGKYVYAPKTPEQIEQTINEKKSPIEKKLLPEGKGYILDPTGKLDYNRDVIAQANNFLKRNNIKSLAEWDWGDNNLFMSPDVPEFFLRGFWYKAERTLKPESELQKTPGISQNSDGDWIDSENGGVAPAEKIYNFKWVPQSLSATKEEYPHLLERLWTGAPVDEDEVEKYRTPEEVRFLESLQRKEVGPRTGLTLPELKSIPRIFRNVIIQSDLAYLDTAEAIRTSPEDVGNIKSALQMYITLNNPTEDDPEKLDPGTKFALAGMAIEFFEQTGEKIQVNSSFRTTEQQQREYAQNLDKAASPGHSMHEKGLAIDINSRNAQQAESLGLLKKYGFYRPIAEKEPWHIVFRGKAVGVDEKPKTPSRQTASGAITRTTTPAAATASPKPAIPAEKRADTPAARADTPAARPTTRTPARRPSTGTSASPAARPTVSDEDIKNAVDALLDDESTTTSSLSEPINLNSPNPMYAVASDMDLPVTGEPVRTTPLPQPAPKPAITRALEPVLNFLVPAAKADTPQTGTSGATGIPPDVPYSWEGLRDPNNPGEFKTGAALDEAIAEYRRNRSTIEDQKSNEQSTTSDASGSVEILAPTERERIRNERQKQERMRESGRITRQPQLVVPPGGMPGSYNPITGGINPYPTPEPEQFFIDFQTKERITRAEAIRRNRAQFGLEDEVSEQAETPVAAPAEPVMQEPEAVKQLEGFDFRDYKQTPELRKYAAEEFKKLLVGKPAGYKPSANENALVREKVAAKLIDDILAGRLAPMGKTKIVTAQQTARAVETTTTPTPATPPVTPTPVTPVVPETSASEEKIDEVMVKESPIRETPPAKDPEENATPWNPRKTRMPLRNGIDYNESAYEVDITREPPPYEGKLGEGISYEETASPTKMTIEGFSPKDYPREYFAALRGYLIGTQIGSASKREMAQQKAADDIRNAILSGSIKPRGKTKLIPVRTSYQDSDVTPQTMFQQTTEDSIANDWAWSVYANIHGIDKVPANLRSKVDSILMAPPSHWTQEKAKEARKKYGMETVSAVPATPVQTNLAVPATNAAVPVTPSTPPVQPQTETTSTVVPPPPTEEPKSLNTENEVADLRNRFEALQIQLDQSFKATASLSASTEAVGKKVGSHSMQLDGIKEFITVINPEESLMAYRKDA